VYEDESPAVTLTRQVAEIEVEVKAVTFVVSGQNSAFESDDVDEKILVNKLIDLYQVNLNMAKNKIASRDTSAGIY
jgi:hypothetical protein